MTINLISARFLVSLLPAFFMAEAALSQQALPLNVVQGKDFCQRVTNAMTTFGTQQGLERRDAMRLGDKASSAIFQQLKSGKMDQFMDAVTFQMSPVASGDRMWLSVPEVLVGGLGIAPQRVLLVENINDLRMTSQIMPGSQVLVVASSAGDLTPERAKLVAKTAQALGLQIDIIWVGQGREQKDARTAQGLAFMTAITGGAFLDLSGQNACGGT
jgi:hypothetical protein